MKETEGRIRLTKVAELLGISHWTLRRWIKEGTAPFIRSAKGRLFVPVSWVEEQLKPTLLSKDDDI